MSDSSYTLPVAAREYIWLYDHRHGVGVAELARQEGVTVDQIRQGLERAEAAEATVGRFADRDDFRGRAGFELVSLFPVGSLTPQSSCPHRGPIPRGSRLVCMVCGQSGMDDYPGLRRDPQTDPLPEPSS